MMESSLVELGLPRNEAKVYAMLARQQRSHALGISRATGLHKSITYDALRRLMQRGLVHQMVEGKATVFAAAPSAALVGHFENRVHEAQRVKDRAVRVATQLDALARKDVPGSQARMYCGTGGIRQYLKEVLERKEAYCVIGAPRESLEIMGEHFWLNHARKAAQARMAGRMLFNTSLAAFSAVHDTRYAQIRFLDAGFEPLTEIIIQGTTVATIIWSQEPVLFLLDDADAAQTYRKHFDVLWRSARKRRPAHVKRSS